jgi:hypothetical protein
MAIGGSSSGIGPGAGSTTGVPTTYNPFRTFYTNALQPGLGSSSASTLGNSSASTAGNFGQPQFDTVTSTATGTSTAGQALTQGSGATGFSTLGMSKAPAYSTALSPDFPFAPTSSVKLGNAARAALERSSALQGQNIQLQMNGPQAILRGRVSQDRMRRLAEGLVRLTPGVQDVVNELQVTGR